MWLGRRQIVAVLVCLALLTTLAFIFWPRHDRLMAQLRRLSGEGRYDQVIAVGERYLARESRSGEFFVVLGNAYQRSKRYQDAVTAYRRALSLDPTNPVIPPLLAEALRALSRQADADAIRWLAEAAACDPTNESIFIDLARYATLDELLLTPPETAGKIVRAWAAASRAHPGLLRNQSVRRVVAQMAVVTGNDALADELLPARGDELATRRLFQAQRALAGGQREQAEAFVREAHAAAPMRQDVLGLMAELGVAGTASFEPLMEQTVPDGDFCVSPDAARLYYDGLRIYDLAEGRLRTPITGVTGFAVSPSGARIAYFVDARDESELYVAKADGSEATLVARGPTYRDNVAWSPDEKHLVFTTLAGLEIIDSDGSGRRVLVPPGGTGGEPWAPGSPTWAPIRDRIAYAICLWEGTGGVSAVTPSGKPAGFATQAELDRPRWSADGRWLLVDPASWAAPGGPPVVLDESGAIRQLADMPTLVKDAAWSREGTWIAYTADDPTMPETLAARGEGSPPVRRLWVRHWPDGEPRLVDVGPGSYGQPQWLPGHRLAFVVRTAQGEVQLHVVRIKQ